MQPQRRLPIDPDFIALQAQVARINKRLGITVNSGATAAKRFRIAVKVLGLSLANIPVQFDVVWSTPLLTDSYNVDVACSALLGMPTVTVSNQTKDGCTITFTPTLVVTNATVIALAVAPL